MERKNSKCQFLCLFLAITHLIIEIGGTYINIDFFPNMRGTNQYICNYYLSPV